MIIEYLYVRYCFGYLEYINELLYFLEVRVLIILKIENLGVKKEKKVKVLKVIIRSL